MPVRRRWARASAALMVVAGLGLAAGTPAHADGSGQILYDNIRDSNTGEWQGWEPPTQPPGTILIDPVVSADAAADSIHVDVITTSGLYDIARDSNGNWSLWEPPPQPPDSPATGSSGESWQIYTASEPDGSIEYFQIYNGYIWYALRYPNGRWFGWVQTEEQVPANTDTMAVTAVGVPGGYQVQFMAMTVGGALWHNILSSTGEWQGWEQPAQVPDFAEAIAAAGLRNGEAEFIAIARNGKVYHTIRSASGLFASWVAPVQPPAGWYGPANEIHVSAAADYNGNAQFVIWDLNLSSGSSTLYHTIRYADGSWQSTGWGKPALAPGWPACGGSVAIPTFNPNDTNLHLDALCVP
jgi:hypothetical protein